MNLQIRQAVNNDFDGVWEIFHSIVITGTYVFLPETSKDEAFSIWMAATNHTYVAILNNKIVATWFLKPNQPGLGAHVCNGVYMVHPDYQGKGIGAQIVIHSLEEAKSMGYQAMQFNLVLSTNVPAVKLYQKLGFKIIGTTPNGFNLRTSGMIDTYIMHRFL